MTTVRDRLAAALREHRFEPCSISESGYLEWWGRCAACGFEGKRRHRRGPEWELNMRCDEVDHQLEVLRALPGIAIVELPEPLGPNRWPVDEDDDDFCVSLVELVRASEAFQTAPTRHPGCKISWGSMEINLCLPDARALAAALLAAVTEVGGR